MGELFHECGVAAVYHATDRSASALTPSPGGVNSVSRLIPRMLLDMQNRGQLASGKRGTKFTGLPPISTTKRYMTFALHQMDG